MFKDINQIEIKGNEEFISVQLSNAINDKGVTYPKLYAFISNCFVNNIQSILKFHTNSSLFPIALELNEI